jgi:hypothetical protein
LRRSSSFSGNVNADGTLQSCSSNKPAVSDDLGQAHFTVSHRRSQSVSAPASSAENGDQKTSDGDNHNDGDDEISDSQRLVLLYLWYLSVHTARYPIASTRVLTIWSDLLNQLSSSSSSSTVSPKRLTTLCALVVRFVLAQRCLDSITSALTVSNVLRDSNSLHRDGTFGIGSQGLTSAFGFPLFDKLSTGVKQALSILDEWRVSAAASVGVEDAGESCDSDGAVRMEDQNSAPAADASLAGLGWRILSHLRQSFVCVSFSSSNLHNIAHPSITLLLTLIKLSFFLV